MNDTKTLISETPTGELRWVWRDEPPKHKMVLQQKWEIVKIRSTFIEERYEWRDVPEGGEQ